MLTKLWKYRYSKYMIMNNYTLVATASLTIWNVPNTAPNWIFSDVPDASWYLWCDAYMHSKLTVPYYNIIIHYVPLNYLLWQISSYSHQQRFLFDIVVNFTLVLVLYNYDYPSMCHQFKTHCGNHQFTHQEC